MMPMGTASIQLTVTMATREGRSLLQVTQSKYSVSSLAKDLLVVLILTIFNNHPVELVYTRYAITPVVIVTYYFTRF